MKVLFASLLIALASSTVAAAAQEPAAAAPPQAQKPAGSESPSPERVELARNFILMSQPADEMIEQLQMGFRYSASEQLDGIEDETERSAAEDELEQFLTRIEPKVRELMPRMKEAYAQVYAREFSADELRAMIAFAESPAGKHYIARFAHLEMEPSLLEAQRELMSGLAPMLDDFRKQMCADRAAKRLAAGDKKATCPLSKGSEMRSS